MRPRVLVLLGPTAVGKTAVAVALCRRLGGEVVAADSRQIYRGLSIGSAAPTTDEIAAAPHHLVQFLDPRARYSVAEYVVAAEAVVRDILARGAVPVLVAGTGMWLRALVEGWTLTETAADPAIRARLEALESPELHARLAAVDPQTAARLPVADRKRIVRALEVYETTGEPLSAQLKQARREVSFDYRLFGLRRDREALYSRIDRRVLAMIEAGWLDEVRALLDAGLNGDELSLEGLGYRALVRHLRGSMTLDEAVESAQRDTRRFAKRQMTWFRGFAEVSWYDLADDTPPDDTAARIAVAWTVG